MAFKFSLKKAASVPPKPVAAPAVPALAASSAGVKRPREQDELASSTTDTNGGGAVEDGETEEMRRRREKLAAWKAKQQPSVSAAASASDVEEGELAPVVAPSKSVATAMSISGPTAMTAALPVQPLLLQTGVSSAPKAKVVASLFAPDDDASPAESAAGAFGRSRFGGKPLISLDDGPDDHTVALPPQANSNTGIGDADDDIDSYMKALGADAIVLERENERKAAASSAAQPAVITAEELEKLFSGGSSATDAAPAGHSAAAATTGAAASADGGNEAMQVETADGVMANGNSSANDSSAPPAAASEAAAAPADDDEDEEYHQRFLESLRGGGGSANGPGPSPTASEASAAADARLETGSVVSSKTGREPQLSAEERAEAEEEEARVQAELAALAASEDGDEDAALYKGEEWEGKKTSALEMYQAKLRAKLIPDVDHSKMDYEPFRKAFYIEPREIAALSPEEVQELRDDLEIKVRGKAIPRPIATWEQAGLPDKLLSVLQARGFAAPFAIQRQALPVIMSGRDVIGVAKTGSGKTLAYLLPLFRQLLDQRPLAPGEGPRAIVMAPSRELVTQIYAEARRFAKLLDLRVTAIYGGSPIAEQIAELKRGSDVVVCSPGRFIELLAMRDGRLVSLARVTYVVLDEADRMFDMGFEPQIAKIMQNIRPDRQVVMFSATFPQHVESLARKALRAPVEVVVGGRSVASADIAQWVEVHPDEHSKFLRTLQLLGEWAERGQVIIFVDTKEHCDSLFTDLLKAGYSALTLHGGKDQVDRDETVSDFKSGAGRILVATSVAGRGLDVKDCVLVINFSVPNHIEDYVHRVGRTGRAGRKGTAFTFLQPNEAQYAPDLCRALKDAKQPDHITPDLKALADEFNKKLAAGEAKKHRSGFTGTKGFKFDSSEMTAGQALKDAQRRSYELEAGIKTIEDIIEEEQAKKRGGRDGVEDEGDGEGAEGEEEGGERASPRGEPSASSAAAAAEAAAAAAQPSPPPPPPAPVRVPADPAKLAILRAKFQTVKVARAAGRATDDDVSRAEAELKEAETLGILVSPAPSATSSAAPPSGAASAAQSAAAQAAAEAAKQLGKQLGIKVGGLQTAAAAASSAAAAAASGPSEELEINDYPEKARKKLFREGIPLVRESYPGVGLTTKGVHVDAGRKPPPGERKLFILIQGPTEHAVRNVRKALLRVLEEETLRAGMSLDKGGGGGGAGGGYAKFTV